MKHIILASLLSTLVATGAQAQNAPAQTPAQTSPQKLTELVEEFVQGPNSCNLFLGVDDSGFDGLTMDYADKLATLLSNDTRSPRETYALIYQRCSTRTSASASTNTSDSTKSQ